jgi:hypothetical protein
LNEPPHFSHVLAAVAESDTFRLRLCRCFSRLASGGSGGLGVKSGSAFLFPVTARAKRDEVAQVKRRAALGDGLDVVNLEPSAARAAGGATAAVPTKYGPARALPFRRGANEHAGFTCGAAL